MTGIGGAPGDISRRFGPRASSDGLNARERRADKWGGARAIETKKCPFGSVEEDIFQVEISREISGFRLEWNGMEWTGMRNGMMHKIVAVGRKSDERAVPSEGANGPRYTSSRSSGVFAT